MDVAVLGADLGLGSHISGVPWAYVTGSYHIAQWDTGRRVCGESGYEISQHSMAVWQQRSQLGWLRPRILHRQWQAAQITYLPSPVTTSNSVNTESGRWVFVSPFVRTYGLYIGKVSFSLWGEKKRQCRSSSILFSWLTTLSSPTFSLHINFILGSFSCTRSGFCMQVVWFLMLIFWDPLLFFNFENFIFFHFLVF